MHRVGAGLVFLTAAFLAACTRTAITPKMEPTRVAVDVAHAAGEDRPGIVLVSRASLVSVDPAAGSALLHVVQGDRVVSRSIAMGAASGEHVEVLSGVAAGDEIVTPGRSDLRDGDRVLTVSRSAPP